MSGKVEKNVILHSEAVNEILTSTPNWIVRWGVSVIFILLLIMTGLSYLIRYPNILISKITLTEIKPTQKFNEHKFGLIAKRQQIIGKCVVPILKTNELTVGQVVNIKLNQYPYRDIGILRGILINVTPTKNNDSCILHVGLQNGLVTSFNKIIPYNGELNGKVEIITKNASVMERVFSKFEKLFNRK